MISLATIYGINAIICGIATVILNARKQEIDWGWFVATTQLLIVTIIFVVKGM